MIIWLFEKTRASILGCILAGVVVVSGAKADEPACLVDGVALGGRDPVSYWRGEESEPGLSSIDFRHGGARYLFANEANRHAFSQDPARYLPRYGGWCAMTLALGRLSCPDVANFRIQDGQLLLFETTLLSNGRVLWEQAPEDNFTRADRNFRRRSELKMP